MSVKEVFLLGDPRLYEMSVRVEPEEIKQLQGIISDLHDTLMDFRKRYGAGKAIAAPQIGVMKRLIYIHIDKPIIFINPVLDEKSEAMMELWDDCMCFPDLLVRVKRHKSCRVRYYNLDFREEEMWLEEDLSELLQHECDHLDGILAVSRAIDGQSFGLRSQRHLLKRESG